MSHDIKQLNQERFGAAAKGYVESATFSNKTELEQLVEITEPQPEWITLDIATGGGHTARTFAPFVKHTIATDLTEQMLLKARESIEGHNLQTVSYSVADAEGLPFANDSFDLVTCRIAPHHFPNIKGFMTETSRVIKTGGFFLLQDHLMPNRNRDAKYIDAFQRLRDPSHVRGYADYEWREMFEDVGLNIIKRHVFTKRHAFMPWVERQHCPPEVVEKLQIMLLQAPPKVLEWIQPEHAGTERASFQDYNIILLGQKH